jgi:SNF2 family DNA or RNA helicase
MGLGKCASAIVAAHKAKMRRVLVIAPKSAVADWLRELQDWHPYPGSIRTTRSRPRDLAFRTGWLIINYEKLKLLSKVLRVEPWDVIILDEAHYTKEIERRRSILIYGGVWKDIEYTPLESRKRLVVSGTPLKGRIEEIQQQLAWLDDGWSDRKAFIDRYYNDFDSMDGLERIETPSSRIVQSCETRDLPDLHARLKSSILVRTPKSQVEGLPPRRYELFEVPVEEDNNRAWFVDKERERQILRGKLRKAYRQRDTLQIIELEQQEKQLRSIVY